MTRKIQEIHSVTIVDDDQAVRDALSNLLESVGMRVEAFTSAEDFVNSRGLSKRTCLILDIQLPGMSGLELQRQLAAGKNLIPIIFITAHGEDGIREQALHDGAVGFFYKPFSSEALLNTVHSAMR
ncbi:MAG: response regulator [Candidatus Acidiferrales bacterium]